MYAAIGYGGMAATRAVNRMKDELARLHHASGRKTVLEKVTEAAERREQQAQKIAEIARDDVHAVLAAVHRAHGEDRFAKTADKAEVDAVHARPAEDRSALGRAEIGIVVLPPHHAERR